MKKLIALFTAVSTVAAVWVPVAMAAGKTVEGTVYGDTVHTEYTDENSTVAVLSFYDEGTLAYSTMAFYKDSGYTFNVPDEYSDMDARICYVGGEIYDMDIEAAEEAPSATPAPSETQAPSATQSPSATQQPSTTQSPTPAPAKTPHPEVYPKALDAVNAPAVVKDVSETVIDGETYYAVDMFYQGEEIKVNIRDWITIESSSEASSYLVGSNASALRDGDVIHFTTDLQGRVKSIEFIYRPDFENYVMSDNNYGNNFEDLISDNGYVANRTGCGVAKYPSGSSSRESYAFGVPVDRQGNTLVLANKSGQLMYIDVDERAMVYTVNGASRGDLSEFTGNGISAVSRTFVYDGNYDEDKESIVSWDGVSDITYALVRIIDDTAVDIVVFTD